MAVQKKASIHDQLTQWKQEQSKKTVDERLNSSSVYGTKKDVSQRLGVWGTFLILVGIGTIITWFSVLRSPVVNSSVSPWLFITWGGLTIVLGIMDLKISNPKLLFPTGIATLINGIYLLIGLSLIWGPVMLIVGALMLRDAFKAQKQQKV